MRTLVVATQIRLPGQHGGTTHVGELKQNLGRFGEVLVLGQRGSSEPSVLGVGLPWRLPWSVQPWLSHLYLRTVIRQVERFKPDVIYERGSSYGLGALLSEHLGVPMVCMVLDEHYSERSLQRAARVIATTEQVVPSQVRHKFVKVSWGANSELFHPECAPIGTDALPAFLGTTLGYSGSMKRWHDLDLLVELADTMREHPLRFVLIGDGPERPRIEATLRARGLQSRFIFTGALPYEEVPRWLVRADLCVAPFRPAAHSASQGNFALDPLKVFEYLALGKPTLTVDSDNLRALFQHEEHALLLPPSDTARWRSSIANLITNPEAARAMAERGRQRVLERHTWAAHAAHLDQLFQELVQP